jgi:hypothetical protein
VRIASPRPLSVASPLLARAVYALLALALAGALVLVGVRIWNWGHGGSTSDSKLTMADAFGFGGVTALPDAVGQMASPVEGNAIVTYYGSPRTPSMGILGQHAPEDVADLLAERAARFEALSPGRPVLPALHLVYGIAQPEPGADGLYLSYLDDRTVRQYIELARRRGFVLILDLQIGHSNALAEVQKILPYLREPDVFVALDPEFSLGGDVRPGDAIGSVDASDINAVQWYLGALSSQERLPKKMLIVHQFQAEMITNSSTIERRPDVDLIIDMDGYGPADIKEVKYGRYAAATYAPFAGIKIFLQHDPDPLTERQLLDLRPRPSLFIYQ